ncbi:MAG: hypothetical protein H7237_00895 [Alkalinema sp. FL-bin-369]|nr:hypothetical protein [Leptolyngbyaceae cyanobacterium LF-bin-369]
MDSNRWDCAVRSTPAPPRKSKTAQSKGVDRLRQRVGHDLRSVVRSLEK